jgi:hypothetical protein
VEQYEMGSLFKNVEVLFEVNKKLLGLLEVEEKKEAPQQQFGRVFIDMVCWMRHCQQHTWWGLELGLLLTLSLPVYQMDELKKYNAYSANNEQAGDTVNKLTRANPSFAALAEEVKRLEECKKLDLAAYIIKPFQRICRYPLLLKVCRLRWRVVAAVAAVAAAYTLCHRNCAKQHHPSGRTMACSNKQSKRSMVRSRVPTKPSALPMICTRLWNCKTSLSAVYVTNCCQLRVLLQVSILMRGIIRIDRRIGTIAQARVCDGDAMPSSFSW